MVSSDPMRSHDDDEEHTSRSKNQNRTEIHA
jgi:hypothetical protein